jgi:hypothetical protein
MRRNPATGKLDFDWDADGSNAGNPKYSDDNIHRVLSLLVEHRPSPATPDGPATPGWVWDRTGQRGSLIYRVKNIRRSTPSQLEAYALDAMQKAVDEGWISNPSAKAYLSPATSARLEVSWHNPGGRPMSIRLPLAH